MSNFLFRICAKQGILVVSGFALVFAPVLPPMFDLALSIDTAKPNLRAKFFFREWMDLLSGTDVALLAHQT